MKLYYTFNQLKKDLPYIRDKEILVASDFEQTTNNLDTYRYKSVKAQLKKQNITVKIYKRVINK